MHQNTLGITKIQTQLDKWPETQGFFNCRGPKIDFSLLEAVAKRKKPPCAAMEDKIGDGICQRKNNNFKCDYDGGDCCGSNVNTQYCNYAPLCQCLEGGGGGSGGTTPPS